jgi:hypothetical protein
LISHLWDQCSALIHKELEAKALFRLLNYCPPPSANVPLLEKPPAIK